jgi:hypothetical protein
MDRKECVETIMYECIAGNGFLVRLRGNDFSLAQFERLIQALMCYRDLIRNQEYIDRSVAYCLYFLDSELIGAIKYSSKEKEKPLLQTAHEKASELIIEILTPENMKGPLPEYLK